MMGWRYIACVGLVCGACGGETAQDPPKKKKPATPKAEIEPDAGDGGGETGVPAVPSLEVLGVESLPLAMLCANQPGNARPVLVQAANLGDRVVQLAIKTSDTLVVLTETGVPVDATTLQFDLYLHGLSLPTTIPAEDGGQPTTQPAYLQNNQTYELVAAALPPGVALTADNLPEEPFLAKWSFVFDAEAPTVTVSQPTTDLGVPTLSGAAQVSGKAQDNLQVGDVVVSFAGLPVGDPIARAAGETTSQAFDQAIDLRCQPTATETLGISARDACGLASQPVEMEVKVVRWPMIRTHATYRAADDDLLVLDTAVLDWDEDGYLDVVMGTSKGLYYALNRGAAEPGTFGAYTKVTPQRTEILTTLDLEDDGRLDLATVEMVKGDPTLVVYRRAGPGQIALVETHALDLAEGSEPTDMIAADLSPHASGEVRPDIVISTDKFANSLVFYKYQQGGEHFELCEPIDLSEWTASVAEGAEVAEAGADAAAGGADGADGADGGADAAPVLVECLFAAAGKAEGLTDITKIEVAEIVPPPEGDTHVYPDIVAGTSFANAIYVFPNRFYQENLLDTAFSQAEITRPWPVAFEETAETAYFCLADFVEVHPALDLVVGTEADGTWRVLQAHSEGAQALPPGHFTNGTDVAENMHVLSMSGTHPAGVSDVACGDFNLDGHQDFALLSQGGSVMQVHLGDGKGNFNLDPLFGDDLNPINEAIGFAVELGASHLRVANLDTPADDPNGRPDFLLDLGNKGFSVYLQRKDAQTGELDLVATRALMTPLGKAGTAAGGRIRAFAVGDVTGDGAPGKPRLEVVALSEVQVLPAAKWEQSFHVDPRQNPDGTPKIDAADYRSWLLKDTHNGVLVYVWSQRGTYGDAVPSYPAAYDHITPDAYTMWQHGGVSVNRLLLADVSISPPDLVTPPSPGQDGRLDIVAIGGQAFGRPSRVMVLTNATGGAFWSLNTVTDPYGTMFTPFDGFLNISEDLNGALLVPAAQGTIPSLVVGIKFNSGLLEPATLSDTLRTCPWDPQKPDFKEEGIAPFWNCPVFATLADGSGKQLPANTTEIVKIATEGPDNGKQTYGSEAGHVVTVHEKTHSMTWISWDGTDMSHPFALPIEKGLGDGAKDIHLADLDNDGLLDLAAVVFKDVVVAYGQDDVTPFESPISVDRDPAVVQEAPTQVVLVDVNNDDAPDVVFSELGFNRLTVYLNLGKKDATSFFRQFHGPIHVPVCGLPSQLEVADFDGDGKCPTILVLCEKAEAVALVQNDTCTQECP